MYEFFQICLPLLLDLRYLQAQLGLKEWFNPQSKIHQSHMSQENNFMHHSRRQKARTKDFHMQPIKLMMSKIPLMLMKQAKRVKTW